MSSDWSILYTHTINPMLSSINSHSTSIATHWTTLQNHGTALITHTNEINALDTTTKKLTEESKGLHIFVQNTNPVLQNHTAKIEELTDCSRRQANDQLKMEQTLSDTAKTVVKLDNQLTEEQKKISLLVKQFNPMSQKVDQQEAALFEEKNKNAILEQQVRDLQNRLEKETKDHEKTKRKLKETKHTVDQVLQRFEHLEATVQQQQKENLETISQLKAKTYKTDVSDSAEKSKEKFMERKSARDSASESTSSKPKKSMLEKLNILGQK